MKDRLARWIVTFCVTFTRSVPRRLLPRRWLAAIARAEAEDREIEQALRSAPPAEKVPSSLQSGIARALRRETAPPQCAPGVKWSLVLGAGAIAAVVVLGFWWRPPLDSLETSAPGFSHSTEEGSDETSGVEVADALQALPKLRVDWEQPLREEQERLAADGLKAMRFLAANFVPEPYMPEVHAQLEKWEAHVQEEL